LDRALIDTGAQHTLLTRAAAAAAGVELGPQWSEMVGFASFSARPAVVRTLRIGELTLWDVPVLVADSPQLLQAGGQASLGIDLLHHLRIVLDYPARRLIAADSGASIGLAPDVATPDAAAHLGDPAWEIPLWTFSFAALSQGTLAGGANARTLIDTGNRSGTFVSTSWANQHLGNQRLDDSHRVDEPLADKRLAGESSPGEPSTGSGQGAVLGRMLIEHWRLGDRDLGRWPIQGSLPPALERLGIMDVLVGHDLLAGYRVDIDLAHRKLRLSRSAGLASP
jgi:predicted aspartyl protease